MSIGVSKIAMFGGGGIGAGSETFNSSGTFAAPAGLSLATISGRGGSGNGGNPGTAGGAGHGGPGGAGGLSAHYTPACGYQCIRPGGSGGAGSPVRGYGAAGNPGSTGVTTTAFGNNWAGGNAGTGGSAGNPGGAGTSTTFNCVPITGGSNYSVTVGPGGFVNASWNAQ